MARDMAVCLGNAPAGRIVQRVAASRTEISKLLAVLGPVSSYGMSRALPTCIIIELPGVSQRGFVIGPFRRVEY